jgi:hypothetical protein
LLYQPPIVRGATQSVFLGNSRGGIVNVNSPLSNINQIFTLEFWFQQKSLSNNNALIGLDQSLNGRIYLGINVTDFNSTNKNIALDYLGFNNVNFNYSTWQLNVTYYVAIVFTPTNIHLYINDTSPISRTTPAFTSNALYLNSINTNFIWNIGQGYTPTGRQCNALLSHVAVYDYALSTEQITAHYNAGKIIS